MRSLLHLASPFPFLPARDCLYLAFLLSEQSPSELTCCRGSGYRAVLDTQVKKAGFSAAREKGSIFNLVLTEAEWCVSFENSKTQGEKSLHRGELRAALCLFFTPPSSSSYFGKLSTCCRRLSLLANLFASPMSCMLYVYIFVLLSGCDHVSFPKYLLLTSLSLPSILSVAFFVL